MCEPISWIENKKGKLWYLTDDIAEELAKDSKSWYDLVGHQAIEKYWKVSGEHLQCPIDANTARLPDEIWEHLMAGHFNKLIKMAGYNFEPHKYGEVQNIKVQGWHSNGQLACSRIYKDGKLDGLYQGWYSDGQLAYSRIYKDGKEDGLCQGWYSNGQLAYSCTYKDGKEVQR